MAVLAVNASANGHGQPVHHGSVIGNTRLHDAIDQIDYSRGGWYSTIALSQIAATQRGTHHFSVGLSAF
jgi:hypothetical protein